MEVIVIFSAAFAVLSLMAAAGFPFYIWWVVVN